MVSPETTNWLYDYGIADISAPDANFAASAPGFSWPIQPINASSNASADVNDSLVESEGVKEDSSKKRARIDSCGSSSSKANREKIRRDKLNDKFIELSTLLEPGRPPKSDKSAVLIDAVRIVTHLRGETQKLKDSNANLQEKIKELKGEKNELREEKQRLKGEKEKLEEELKSMNSQGGSFVSPVMGNKLVPIMSYPGVAMWQFMPPASVDTSQDHVLRPPVA